MKQLRFTKHAIKQLKKISKSDINTARRIKKIIISLNQGKIVGETLQGHPDFFKIRVGKYRLIHTMLNNEIIVTLIEKRETVYKTFQHLLNNANFLDTLPPPHGEPKRH
jgi:mRNA interferase RelE/StbE